MSRKKSFFERLTGSIDVSDNDYREYDDYGNQARQQNDEYDDFHNDEFSNKPQQTGAQDAWAEHGYEDDSPEHIEDEGELAVDVYETPEQVVVQAMVAGVRPDQLDVAITREMCTISGRREAPRDASRDEYMNSELYWGSFSRSIILPGEVEVEESEASENHGLLTIRLPKINKDMETKLEVQSS